MLWLATYLPHLSAVEHLRYLRLVERENRYSDVVVMLGMPTLFLQYPGYFVAHWLGLDRSTSAYVGYFSWLILVVVNATMYLLPSTLLSLIALRIPMTARWITVFVGSGLLKVCALLLLINIASMAYVSFNREAVDYLNVGVVFGIVSLVIGFAVCWCCYKWTRANETLT